LLLSFNADLEMLHILLTATLDRMTQWDMYQAEVESGHLQWGAVHDSEFFRKHVKLFEGPDGDFALVQVC
jgi:V-ATPase subunit H